jgi:hypothetical protein
MRAYKGGGLIRYKSMLWIAFGFILRRRNDEKSAFLDSQFEMHLLKLKRLNLRSILYIPCIFFKVR